MDHHTVDSLFGLDSLPAGASKLSVAVHRLSRLLRKQLGARLTKFGPLTLVEWRIFVGLSQGKPITQKALVQFTKMEQGQTSRSLASLEKRGLIASKRSTDDGRVRQFSLTRQGKSCFEKNLPVVSDFCKDIDDALSQAETRILLDMLIRIANASGEASPISDCPGPTHRKTTNNQNNHSWRN